MLVWMWEGELTVMMMAIRLHSVNQQDKKEKTRRIPLTLFSEQEAK
jgi:hypothetical protein